MTPEPPKIIQLDQIEPVAGPGTLTWRPVRWTLGVRAFGCNAYTANAAGEDVVEPHTEDPKLAHQELYFVARGRATFTIDGASYDAPAGTYVFVPDPASHRQAVAAEAGTTVLTFGGPPTFKPSPWEWSFRASAVIRTDPERARAILAEGLERYPDHGSLHYNLACLEAVHGRREQVLEALRLAFELRPDLVEVAPGDEDFASLQDDPEFRELVERSNPA